MSRPEEETVPGPGAIRAAEFTGPIRVVAGPGCGKTEQLVRLYAELVREGHASPAQVLVLSYSKASAEELERRIRDLLPEIVEPIQVSTIHSFCARLLEAEADTRLGEEGLPGRGRPRIVHGVQEWLVMREVIAATPAHGLGRLAPLAGNRAFSQDVLAFASLLKQNLVEPEPVAAAAGGRLAVLAGLASAYDARLAEAGLSDFRDLVRDAVRLLESGRGVELAARYTHVMVDEFQDIDPAQFRLLRALVPPGPEARLLVVGDADQAIYGFRGSVPGILGEEFERVYPAARTIFLDRSHRCPAPVLEAAYRLLEATQPRPPQRVSGKPGAAPVKVVTEADADSEARFVARDIRRLMLERDDGDREPSFAILLRSVDRLGRAFAEHLESLGVPFTMRGGTLLNPVVADLLDWFDALRAPAGAERLERVLALGATGPARKAIGRLRAYAARQGRSPRRALAEALVLLGGQDPEGFPVPLGADLADGRPETLRVLNEELPGGPAAALEIWAGRLGGRSNLEAVHRHLARFDRLLEAASHPGLLALAYRVLEVGGGLESWLRDPAAIERQGGTASLRAALAALQDVDQVLERLRGRPPTLLEFGPELRPLLARAAEETEPVEALGGGVCIFTVHQAKGLEFDHVYVCGLAEELFPVRERVHPLLTSEDREWLTLNFPQLGMSILGRPDRWLEEEARLAYVAMTRARQSLTLTRAEDYGSAFTASRFLSLIGTTSAEMYPTRLPAVELPLLTQVEVESRLAAAHGHEEVGPRSRLENAELEDLEKLGVDVEFVVDPAAGADFVPWRTRVPEVNPGRFSASALNNYLRCPRYYWYENHPGLCPSPGGEAQRRGSFLHSVFETVFARESEWSRLPRDQQRTWLRERFEEKLPEHLAELDAAWQRSHEAAELRDLMENFVSAVTGMQPLWRRATREVELRFVLKLPELNDHELTGIIDRVVELGDGTFEVVDYKTGRDKTVRQAYNEYFGEAMLDVQLAVYWLACQEGMRVPAEPDAVPTPVGLRPSVMSLWYPKRRIRDGIRQVLFVTGPRPPGEVQGDRLQLNEEDLARGRETVVKAAGGVLNGNFDPMPREAVGTCRHFVGCPHESVCPFAGRAGRTAAR